MNFSRMVVRPSFLTLIVAGLSTAVLVFLASMVVGETRMGDMVALNQWLARDIASQFSGVASRALTRAQKFGELVRRDSGNFDAGAQRDFDHDPSLKAVWVLDAGGAGALQPIARLERDGFKIADNEAAAVRKLTEAAVQSGSATRGIAQGLTAIAVKIGDMPRTVVLFSDEAIFSRANGGPWGDKWLLLAPSADRTESVLVEATSELREGVNFPSFDEISRLVTAQTPAQERSEFTSEIVTSAGNAFQISGVQTGAFGVMAVAVTPLENSFGGLGLMVRLAVGIAVSFSLFVLVLQTIRYRRIPRVDLALSSTSPDTRSDS